MRGLTDKKHDQQRFNAGSTEAEGNKRGVHTNED
jgi:hypothetical protein